MKSTLGEVGGSSHTTKELSHDRKSSMAFFAPISRGVKLPPFTMGNGLEYDTNPYFFIYFYFQERIRRLVVFKKIMHVECSFGTKEIFLQFI